MDLLLFYRHMNNIDIVAPTSFILIVGFCVFCNVFKVGLLRCWRYFCSNYTCPQYCSKKYNNHLVSVLKWKKKTWISKAWFGFLRSSLLQMFFKFFKIDVLKNFPIFTGNTFVGISLLKRDSSTVVFSLILRNF